MIPAHGFGLLIGLCFCSVYLKSSDDMTQTLIAIAFAKIKDMYGHIDALDWSLGNLHVQHLNWTISAAFNNPQGNEAAIDWFFDNWGNVCRLC